MGIVLWARYPCISQELLNLLFPMTLEPFESALEPLIGAIGGASPARREAQTSKPLEPALEPLTSALEPFEPRAMESRSAEKVGAPSPALSICVCQGHVGVREEG